MSEMFKACADLGAGMYAPVWLWIIAAMFMAIRAEQRDPPALWASTWRVLIAGFSGFFFAWGFMLALYVAKCP